MDDVLDLDATGQNEVLRAGELQPHELVEAAVRRVEATNADLNAVIHPSFEQALDRARAVDPARGRLAGVPMVTKDLTCREAGLPFHEGSRFLKDEIGWIGPDDQELAVRFRAAGLVSIGRTNTPEFGLQASCEPVAYGPTRNPCDPTRSAGGSSGGSAAAVASRMVAIGHGNDAGGSLRVPSAFCGLVGLKPSRHRVSLAPDFGDALLGILQELALTRSVRDAAAVLDEVAGPAPGEWAPSWPLPGPLADEVGRDPGRLTIGVCAEPEHVPVDPGVASVVTEVGAQLERIGHHVTDDRPEALLEEMVPLAGPHFAAASAWVCDHHWPRVTGYGQPIPDELLEPTTLLLRDLGRGIDGGALLEVRELTQLWTRRLLSWWRDHDVLVLPTVAVPPPPLGTTDDVQVISLTVPFNLSGQPAISLPLGRAAGLPVGVQLVAAHGREDQLVRLASQLEAAVGPGEAP